MLRKPGPEQTALEMVTLEELVPADHLLRKIEAVIDFSFIHDRVAGLYCADNGRPVAENPHLFQRDIENIVNAILDEIGDAMARGDRVELRSIRR